MFKIKCWYISGGVEKNTAEKIAIRCSNCGKETMTDVDNLNTKYQDIITNFVLNKMSHHVGILWIIETYEKLHGKVFEGFIRNARTDRYNIMFAIDAREKINPSEHYDGGRSGVYPLPSNSTTKALVFLDATIDFIGCWLKANNQ